MFMRFLLIVIVCQTPMKVAFSDYHQYTILTTEWLVDHSSVICIAEFDDAKSRETDSFRHVVRTFKGNAKTLKWPLKREEDFVKYNYFGPSDRGKLRLLFVGENSQILQAVELGREQSRYDLYLSDVFYGTDQYGQLHLTESSLIHSIRNHLNAPPSKRLPQRRTATFFDRSGVSAPPYFPFETNHETYVLIVNFTERRRDYYLKLLRTGDCAERLDAIGELSVFDDSVAVAGIEAATKASDVEPSHIFGLKDPRVGAAPVEPDEMVRTAARNAIKKLRKVP